MKEITLGREELFEPNIYINMLFEISGIPADAELKTAAEKALCANESTMSKIVISENGRAYYMPLAQSGCSVVISGEDWKSIIQQQEKIPFAIDKGELMRIIIIHRSGKVQILLMAHHLVGDGKSLVYFMEDFMKALNGQKCPYKGLNLLTMNDIPVKNGILASSLNFYTSLLNNQWKKHEQVFLFADYYKLQKKYWSEQRSEILQAHFTAGEVEQLHTNAVKNGVTVTSQLAAAFAYAAVPQGRKCNVGVAVNVRNSNIHRMTNQVSGICVNLSCGKNFSAERTAKKFYTAMQKILKQPAKKYFVLSFMGSLSPSLVDSLLFYKNGLFSNSTTAKLANIAGYTSKKCRDLGITNLAKLDIPLHSGRYQIEDCIFVPPAVSYSKRVIGIVTLDTGMNISYHFTSIQNRKKEEVFFNDAIRHIKKMCVD